MLRRLSQINDAAALPLVMANLDTLYPVFKDVLGYITGVRKLSASQRHDIGKKLLRLIGTSEVGHLEYHRCWILNTFTNDHLWNNEKRFGAVYEEHADQFTRREIICAMGRAHREFWFKTMKKNFDQFNAWERRAFLAACSCLPGDEAKFFYKSVRPRLDILEQSVCDWAEKAPW